MSTAITAPRRGASALPRTATLLGLGVLTIVVSALILTLLSPTTAGDTVGVASVDGAPASGTLSLDVGRDDRATLTLRVAGLTPGLEYPVHLHSGTPAQPGASLGVLGLMRAGADGSAQLTASSVRAGAVGVPVDLTGALLADGPRFVDVHQEGAPDAIAVATVPARP